MWLCRTHIMECPEEMFAWHLKYWTQIRPTSMSVWLYFIINYIFDFWWRNRKITIVTRLCNEVIKRLVDVQNNKIKTRKLALQTLGCCIQFIVEWNCCFVCFLYTFIAVLSKYCNHCWYTSKWWQCCHSNLPCSQLIQFLSKKGFLVKSRTYWEVYFGSRSILGIL